MSGDLLEACRESILTERGAGDRWYVRQVSWQVLCATRPWALLGGGFLVGRYLLDTLVPTQYTRGVAHSRSTIMN